MNALAFAQQKHIARIERQLQLVSRELALFRHFTAEQTRQLSPHELPDWLPCAVCEAWTERIARPWAPDNMGRWCNGLYCVAVACPECELQLHRCSECELDYCDECIEKPCEDHYE